MTRLRGNFELRGDPRVLAAAPEPALLREAGAPKTARAIEKALDLRARCSEAKAALSEAQRALHEADKRDRAEHAQAVAKSPNATLEPKHAEAARKVAEAAERRHAALEAATETAADELVEIGSAEADTLLAAARQVRERSVERVERAAEEIEQAVAEQQAATSIAKWAADPAARRWKVALATGEVGRPGIRIDKLIAGNAALGAWLAQQPLPDEEAEQPRVHFGWHGGTVNTS